MWPPQTLAPQATAPSVQAFLAEDGPDNLDLPEHMVESVQPQSGAYALQPSSSGCTDAYGPAQEQVGMPTNNLLGAEEEHTGISLKLASKQH